MQFDDNGYLVPYRAIESNLNEIVQEFCFTEQRALLYQKFLSYNSLLLAILGNKDFKQWINGSFVSKKVVPNDIDFVSFIDYQLFEKHEKELDFLRNGAKIQGLDSYFIKVYPQTHRNYAITEGDSADWFFTFSYTRRNKQDKRFQKGFIELTFNDYDNR
jgi:hypothetical protein